MVARELGKLPSEVDEMSVADFWGFLFYLDYAAEQEREYIAGHSDGSKPGAIQRRAHGISSLTEQQRIDLLMRARKEKQDGLQGR